MATATTPNYYSPIPFNPTQPATISSATGTVIISGNLAVEGRLEVGHKLHGPMNLADLEHEVYKTPIETLANIWLARFGNNWVKAETICEDKFFCFAHHRLISAAKMEAVHLYEKGSHVRLIPEN